MEEAGSVSVDGSLCGAVRRFQTSMLNREQISGLDFSGRFQMRSAEVSASSPDPCSEEAAALNDRRGFL